jgi:hypothetical protein
MLQISEEAAQKKKDVASNVTVPKQKCRDRIPTLSACMTSVKLAL